MIICAVFDTNVVVSGLLSRRPDSAVVQTLNALLEGKVVLIYNEEILEEYEEVLHRDKFMLPVEEVDAVLSYIKAKGIACNRVKTQEDFQDSDDIVFYEVALSLEDALLVTGNTRHFPKNPIVVSPSEFLKILDSATG